MHSIISEKKTFVDYNRDFFFFFFYQREKKGLYYNLFGNASGVVYIKIYLCLLMLKKDAL